MSKHEEKVPVHSPRRHGRTVPVLVTALTLVVGSATLWTSPASARIFDEASKDKECLPLNPSADWNGHWLLNIGGPNKTDISINTIVGETVNNDLSTDLVITFQFEDKKSNAEDFRFDVEFFDAEVDGSGYGCNLNYSNPPAGVCVTFSTTGWNPSLSNSSAYDNVDEFTFENLDVALDTKYEFDLTDVSGATAQGYSFVFEDAATGEGRTFTATLGLCSRGGDGDDSSGRRPSVDLDHYRERAAAEASSLPNTL